MDHEKSLNVPSDGDEVHPDAKKLGLPSGQGIHTIHNGAPSKTVDGHLVELEVDLARVIGGDDDDVEGDWDADTSPFAAVRAVVPETDDPEMPVNTARAWFLGVVRYNKKKPCYLPIRVCALTHRESRSLSSSAPASTNSSASGTPACTS